jgi:hypothetical protein
MRFPNPHARIDEENRRRDRITAAALRTKPELLQQARENLQRWLSIAGDSPHQPLLEWQAIIDFLTIEELANFLESRSPKAERLRQSSPFIETVPQGSALAP